MPLPAAPPLRQPVESALPPIVAGYPAQPLAPLRPLGRSTSNGGYFGLTPARTTSAARTPTAGGGGGGGGGQASRLLWRGALGLADGSALDGLAFVSHLTFPGVTASGTRTGGASPAGSASAAGTPPAAATFNPFSPSAARRSSDHQQQQGTPTASALPSQDPDLGLSLALESLRGRAAVRFRGRVALTPSAESVAAGRAGPTVEGNGGVRLYVDPACPALYAFLYRQLLLLPVPNATPSPPKSNAPADCSGLDDRGRSLAGVLISLGDESIGEAPLVIYALEATDDDEEDLSRGPACGRAPSRQRRLGLHVGVYHAPSTPTPVGPPTLIRPSLGSGAASAPAILSLGANILPDKNASDDSLRRSSNAGYRSGSGPSGRVRPDDPAPRRVPELKDVLARGKRRRDSVASGDLPPVTGSSETVIVAQQAAQAKRRVKLERPTMSEPVAAAAKVSSGEAEPMDGIASDAERTTSTSAADDGEPATTDEAGEMKDDDLVLPPAPCLPASSSARDGAPGGSRKKSLYEADNKTTIKRVAMQALAERGLAKADGRFRDVWNMVSRGALFAFRDELAGRVLGMRDILAVVEGHLDLYLRPASIEQG